ncbi:MAG TPA: FAD-dependent oxidoreductase [Herpetosiphonaceae bacterium]
MAEPFDALIVGAGIVGAACARELARAGLRVALVERDAVGSGATAASMGHLVAMDDSPAQLLLTSFSQTLWDGLAGAAPERCDYDRCGTLWVAADDEELAAVEAKRAVYADAGIASEILGAGALYAREPELRPGLAGGLLVPGDSVIYPPRAAALLLEDGGAAPPLVLRGTVASLADCGVTLSDGRFVGARLTVIATGAVAAELAPGVPIRPKKGHLAITDRYSGFARHQLIELGYIKNAHAAEGDSVAFNVQPRPNGQLLIGSSRQYDRQDRQIDYPLLAEMLRRAQEYMPGLERLSCLRVWTGVRAATPDGLPLVGPLPGRPGVWLATGHEGLGITTAPATAHLLAAQILGRAPAIPIEPYLPARLMGQEAADV